MVFEKIAQPDSAGDVARVVYSRSPAAEAARVNNSRHTSCCIYFSKTINARDGREMNSASRQRRLNLPRHSERRQNSTVADATREKFTGAVGLNPRLNSRRRYAAGRSDIWLRSIRAVQLFRSEYDHAYPQSVFVAALRQEGRLLY